MQELLTSRRKWLERFSRVERASSRDSVSRLCVYDVVWCVCVCVHVCSEERQNKTEQSPNGEVGVCVVTEQNERQGVNEVRRVCVCVCACSQRRQNRTSE